MCYIIGVLRDIPNEDKKARLFKNLRLEIFVSPCVISKVVFRENNCKDEDNNKDKYI